MSDMFSDLYKFLNEMQRRNDNLQAPGRHVVKMMAALEAHNADLRRLTRHPFYTSTDDIKPRRARTEGREAALYTTASRARRKREGLRWQDVRDKLAGLAATGKRFTSYAELADRFQCSTATVYKALRRTPGLHLWQRQQKKGRTVRLDSEGMLQHLIAEENPDSRADSRRSIRVRSRIRE